MFAKLRLFGLDPYDLVFGYLTRKLEVDADDARIIKSLDLDLAVLETRQPARAQAIRHQTEVNDTTRLWKCASMLSKRTKPRGNSRTDRRWSPHRRAGCRHRRSQARHADVWQATAFQTFHNAGRSHTQWLSQTCTIRHGTHQSLEGAIARPPLSPRSPRFSPEAASFRSRESVWIRTRRQPSPRVSKNRTIASGSCRESEGAANCTGAQSVVQPKCSAQLQDLSFRRRVGK